MKIETLESLQDQNILKLHCVLNETQQWLPRVGKTLTRKFFFGLLKRLSDENVIKKLIILLSSSSQKDFVYTRSRSNPGLPSDITTLSSNRALSETATNKYITEVWDWFQNTTKHCKIYFLLHVLKLCEDSSLSHQARNFCNVLLAQNFSNNTPSDDIDIESIKSSEYSFRTDEHPNLYQLASINPEYSKIYEGSISQLSDEQTHEIDDATITDNDQTIDPRALVLITSNAALSGVSKHVDFISLLPVHLSKSILDLQLRNKILAKFSPRDLFNCALTSKRWRLLVSQVRSDEYSMQIIKEEAILLQGISAKGCNPNYARMRKVLLPLINEETNDVVEAYNVPEDDFFGAPRDPEKAFEAVIRTYKTSRYNIEERNVYCGAYNLLVLDNRMNSSRIIAYAGDNNMVVGSTDKLVRTIDIASGRDIKPTMHGHPGSITALYMGTVEEGMIYSGSYDTTIRKWNITTGSCQQIMHGHRGSITCLDYNDGLLVSGATDGHLKVWNSARGNCICTFKHSRKSTVTCVKIIAHTIVSSCAKGLIKVWSTKTRKLIKILKNHGGKRVNCVYFDDKFLVSGGDDCFLLLWYLPGTKSICLKAYRHPKPVTCVKLLYLCAITGCGDGKIRVINMLTSECLRVLRGNSQCDPIIHLCASNNKLLVNTVSNCLVMHFEPVTLDYTVQSSLSSTTEDISSRKSARPTSSMHSFSRANKLHITKSADKRILRSTSAPQMRSSYSRQNRSKSSRSAPLITNYAQSRPPSNYIDLQPEFIRPKSSYTQVSSHSSEVISNTTSRTRPQSVSAQSKLSLHSGLSYLSLPKHKPSQIRLSESRISSAVSSRGPHHAKSRDNVLVKVGMLQNLSKHDKLAAVTEMNAISMYDRPTEQPLTKSIWCDDILNKATPSKPDRSICIGKFTTTEDEFCNVKMVYKVGMNGQPTVQHMPRMHLYKNDPFQRNLKLTMRPSSNTQIEKPQKEIPIAVDLFMHRQLGLVNHEAV